MTERNPRSEVESAPFDNLPPDVYRRDRSKNYQQDVESFTVGDWILDTDNMLAAVDNDLPSSAAYSISQIRDNLGSLASVLVRQYPEIGQEILAALQDQSPDADFGEIGHLTKQELHARDSPK